jgi:hypothetical protein
MGYVASIPMYRIREYARVQIHHYFCVEVELGVDAEQRPFEHMCAWLATTIVEWFL